jgi:hypothetical protein
MAYGQYVAVQGPALWYRSCGSVRSASYYITRPLSRSIDLFHS